MAIFKRHIFILSWHAKTEVVKLKKIISIFIFALFLFAIPFNAVKAEETGNKNLKKQFAAQIKEKQKLIREKTLAVKKMETHLDSMTEEMGKAYENLFSREMPPNEDMISKIETKQNEILTSLLGIAKIDRAIKIEKLQAKVNIDKQNYQQALINYDNIMSLLEKEEVLLNAYSKSMHEFISLVKSLQYK
jgi:septal ring factor EnvC (AmiA/AmiB activator)